LQQIVVSYRDPKDNGVTWGEREAAIKGYRENNCWNTCVYGAEPNALHCFGESGLQSHRVYTGGCKQTFVHKNDKTRDFLKDNTKFEA
jgi:hypothetical protein